MVLKKTTTKTVKKIRHTLKPTNLEYWVMGYDFKAPLRNKWKVIGSFKTKAQAKKRAISYADSNPKNKMGISILVEAATIERR